MAELTPEMEGALDKMAESLKGNITQWDASIQRVSKADRILPKPEDRRTSTRYSERQATAVAAIDALELLKFKDMEPDSPTYGQIVGGLDSAQVFVRTYENCMVSLNGESLKEFVAAIQEHPQQTKNYTHVGADPDTVSNQQKKPGFFGRVKSFFGGGESLSLILASSWSIASRIA